MLMMMLTRCVDDVDDDADVDVDVDDVPGEGEQEGAVHGIGEVHVVYGGEHETHDQRSHHLWVIITTK